MELIRTRKELAVFVGARMQEAREDSGCENMEDAARMIAVKGSTYRDWESGRRLADALSLMQFARAFHRPMDYFYPVGRTVIPLFDE